MFQRVSAPMLLAAGLLLCVSAPVLAADKARAADETARTYAELTWLADPAREGRAPETPGHEAARHYILKGYQEAGLVPCMPGAKGEAAWVQTFAFSPRRAPEGAAPQTGRNLIACRMGSKAKADSPVIVVGAHYDHLGMRDGKIWHGADDNASGVAGLLSLARTLKPEHTVVFIAFDAEEQGLRGAEAYVKAPLFPLAQTAVMVNLDMIGRGDKGELYASGTYHTPAFKPLLERAQAADTAFALRLGHDRPEQGSDDWTLQSDHGPFFRAGVPHLYFGVEDHPDYHQPTDTADKITPAFLGWSVRTIKASIQQLDAAIATEDFRKK